jgi:capsular exopolysaccharide synthesis family protein
MIQANDANLPASVRRPSELKPSGGPRRGSSQPPAILNAAPNLVSLLRCLRRRLVLALTLGVLLAGPFGTGTWLFAPPPKHQVRTLISVPQGGPYLVRTSERVPDLTNHQRNQVALTKSRLVLNSALRDPDVAELSILAKQPDPVEWLEKEVQVDFSVAPEILRISMSGLDTDELVVLVDALREAYLREVVDKDKSQRKVRMDYVGEQIVKYEGELKTLRDEQRPLEEKLGSKSADVRARTQSFLQRELAVLEAELLKTRSARRQANLALITLEARQKQFDKLVIVSDLDVNEALANNREILALQDEIKKLETKIDEWVRRSPQGKAHPTARGHAATIASRKREIKKITERERPAIVKQLRQRARLDLQTNLTIQKTTLANLEDTEKTLVEEVEKLRARVAEFGKQGIKLDNFREDMSPLEDMTKRLKTEQKALQIELAAPTREWVIEEATVLRSNTQARKIMLTAGAALGGFFLVLFGVALLEHRTRRINTVDEVVLGLGMRLLGTIPCSRRVARSVGGKPGRGLAVARQVLRESVDAVRTALLHQARSQALRTVMVTSATAREGKTSLSCHLAASLAGAGLKVLLIDGDMRHPTAHKLFGLPSGPGLSEVLGDRAELHSSIQATSVPGLSLLPAGVWNEQTPLALNRGKAAALFAQLSKDHDIIIIDSSPILPVADTLLLAQQVDGVLFSSLCGVSRLTDLYAAWQRIEELGIAPLGVVIGGVQGGMYGSTSAYPYPRKARMQA